MFAWLEGPGESFKHPLPNSTNYLSAYDRRGKLLREGENTPETQQDLRPFPLNPHFVSESILSEPLREEVWRRVIIEKKSVRTVSVELGIEMRRVGAVVRLVELEKRMREEVSSILFTHSISSHDEYHKSISLSDFHHGVQTNKLQLSDANHNVIIFHKLFRVRITDRTLI